MNRIIKYISAVLGMTVVSVMSALAAVADGAYKTPATNDYMVWIFIVLAVVAFVGIIVSIITMIVRRRKNNK